MEKLEAELARWRQGETVKPEEQVNLQDGPDVTTPIAPPVEGKFKIGMNLPNIGEKSSASGWQLDREMTGNLI